MKTQQRFKSERHDVFTEEINKIVLSANDDRWMESADWKEIYKYETKKDLVSDKEVIKCHSIKNRYIND